MKIVTASNGKKSVKMSKSEWQQIGKKAGWTKISQEYEGRVGNPYSGKNSSGSYDDLQTMTFEELKRYVMDFTLKYKQYADKLEEANQNIKDYTRFIANLDSEINRIKTFINSGYDDVNKLTQEQKEDIISSI
jgi:hypothetical protein